MKKVKKYDAEEAKRHYEELGPRQMTLDELRDHVYSVTEESESNGGGGKAKKPPAVRNKQV